MSVLMHGGNLKDISSKMNINIKDLKDFSSNLNPLGPPEGLLDYLRDNINDLLVLPEYDSQAASGFFSELMNIDTDRIVPGNGTTEFIRRLPNTLKAEKALILGPTYSDYEKSCLLNSVKPDYIYPCKDLSFKPDYDLIEKKVSDYDLVFICNPNNPTGYLFEKDFLKDLCMKNPDTFFIIDETYLPFEENFEKVSMSSFNYDNLIVLFSLSKIFTLPGLRLGFMVLPSAVNKNIYDLPWKVSAPAAGVCSYLNNNKTIVSDFFKKTSDFIKKEKKFFTEDESLIQHFNFINENNIYTLAKLKDEKISSDTMFDFFIRKNIVLRDCSNIKGLGNRYIRFSFKNHEDNILLKEELIQFFKGNK